MKEKKPTILVVDEDPMYLKVWEKVFRIVGDINYSLTNDPLAAEALIKERKIDFLISEVIMEHKTGYHLAELARAKNTNAKIVLTTTYDCKLARFNLKKPEFAVLYKPYQSIEDVIHFISDLLNKADPRKDLDEESWSENIDYPQVIEWKL